MKGTEYQDYLKLKQLLDCQKLISVEKGQPAHDEMLFITVHQVYELWFKQIIFELDSILTLLGQKRVDDEDMGTVVSRLERIHLILQVATENIEVLETMTPLDFLDFREFLYPASGFQSVQFRVLENKLGLRASDRITYNQAPYAQYFSNEDQETLTKTEKEQNLFTAVEGWLERTPFLQIEGFDFWHEYQQAVQKMFDREQEIIRSNHLLKEEEIQKNLQILEASRTQFKALFDEKEYDSLKSKGQWRLNHRAAHAALLIQLYRHQPIFQLPFRLITALLDLDDTLTHWRYRHALMARRMLGTKIGTGGSSGSQYLKDSTERHKIFDDFFKLTTFFIPKSELPELPDAVKSLMRFRYSEGS